MAWLPSEKRRVIVFVLLRHRLHPPARNLVIGVFASLQGAFEACPHADWRADSQGRWVVDAEPFGYVIEEHLVEGLDS